jgi:ATP-binding cassette subfamily F protein uup
MLRVAGFEDPGAPAGPLSGGWKKRLAIAAACILDPDLLLLDEPTNHLDIDGILWLESLLLSPGTACVVVSHDRYFLENVATEMAEINRVYPNGIFRVRGNYSEFLERRQEQLEAQAKQQEALAVKVRREVEWLRRGPKARTGKSKARIDSAGRLIAALDDAESRSARSQVRLELTATGRKTRRLLAVDGIAKTVGGRTLFRDLSFVLTPATRLGLIGRNGAGKTTLLRLLKGDLEPDAGSIARAPLLRARSFDQNRLESLDPLQPLRKALCPEGDSVLFRGRPIHVAGWARRFLFHPAQLELPVGSLSGGEKARLLIARLMLEPADLLLLDEPANDLDLDTLEVLEENLLDFPGAIVLITHDRYLLDRVATQVLALGPDGDAGLFSDYSQWEQTRAARRAEARDARPARPARPLPSRKKLSFKDQKEWDGMEQRILEAESALETARLAVQAAAESGDAKALRSRHQELEAAQAEVERLYARWAELEQLVLPATDSRP